MPNEMKANIIYIVLEKEIKCARESWHYVTTSEIPWRNFCCLLNVPGDFPVAVTAFVYTVFFEDVKQVFMKPACRDKILR